MNKKLVRGKRRVLELDLNPDLGEHRLTFTRAHSTNEFLKSKIMKGATIYENPNCVTNRPKTS